MKISLVVASGVHQGKPIPIAGPQFIIGRDEGCHLRPASPAISKQHCALFIRDNKAFIRDMESTNGTFINDEPVTGERELANGDRLKVGPLDFTVVLAPGGKTDSTPLPDALKAVGKSGEQKPAPRPTPAPTPKPAPPSAAADDPDKIAAMLLGMGDDEAEVPGGSTIMDMPSVEGGTDPAADAAKAEEEKKKKLAPSAAETSAAASEILRRYMKRPR